MRIFKIDLKQYPDYFSESEIVEETLKREGYSEKDIITIIDQIPILKIWCRKSEK